MAFVCSCSGGSSSSAHILPARTKTRAHFVLCVLSSVNTHAAGIGSPAHACWHGGWQSGDHPCPPRTAAASSLLLSLTAPPADVPARTRLLPDRQALRERQGGGQSSDRALPSPRGRSRSPAVPATSRRREPISSPYLLLLLPPEAPAPEGPRRDPSGLKLDGSGGPF